MKRIKKSNRNNDVHNSIFAHWTLALFTFLICITLILVWYFIDIKTDVPKWASIIGVLAQTIGTSTLASLIFYFLYSIITEPTVIKNISSNVAEIAINYASEQFSLKFDNLLPQKIYPKTLTPMQEFNSDFDELVKKSKIYYFLGDAASFTAVRLARYRSEGLLIDKDVKVLMLDPTEKTTITQRIQNEYPKITDRIECEEKIKEFTDKIFSTIYALYEISIPQTIEVAFHKEHLVFRYEILNEGLFLTYRLGGEALNTYLYNNNTVSYQAHYMHFLQCWQSSTNKLRLGPDVSETEMLSFLKSLGCQYDIDELKKIKTKNFSFYENHV